MKILKTFITIYKLGKKIIMFGDVEVETTQISPTQKPNFNI